jgi:hypothetical protein
MDMTSTTKRFIIPIGIVVVILVGLALLSMFDASPTSYGLVGAAFLFEAELFHRLECIDLRDDAHEPISATPQMRTATTLESHRDDRPGAQ